MSVPNYSNTIYRDFINTICGKRLGGGAGRDVYACTLRDDLVIKIEDTSRSFQNIMEWRAWNDFQNVHPIKRWLAPCEMISPCGVVLLQKKTTPVTTLPPKVPDFFTDCKPENIGMYEGRWVLHDYGTITLCLSDQLKTPEWLRNGE